MILLLVVMLVYVRAVDTPFQFDDFNVIVNEARIHSLEAWWHSMPGIRPLLKLGYAINWQISESATGFHLFNILLHLCNTLLLWTWLRLFLEKQPQGNTLAFSITLLWALHPALTEAVSYVSGRSMSQMAFFVFLTLICAEKIRRNSSSSIWHVLSALFTAAALATRETAAILPMLVMLTQQREGRSLKQALLVSASSLVVTVIALLLALGLPDYQRFMDNSLSVRNASEQWHAAIAAHAYLLTKPVLSLTPNIDPDIRMASASSLRMAASLLVLMIFSCLFFFEKKPLIRFGIAWWLLNLAPVLVFPRNDIASDRHTYLALVGLIFVFAHVLSEILKPLPFKITCIVLLMVFALTTLIRNEDYRTPVSLWARTVEQSPLKARAWNNLGSACETAGELACAKLAWHEALRLDPAYQRARINLLWLNHQATPQTTEEPPTNPQQQH